MKGLLFKVDSIFKFRKFCVHQWSLFHDTNSSTLLDKLVDFVGQTRRLCWTNSSTLLDELVKLFKYCKFCLPFRPHTYVAFIACET
jgi:hypothetical protein